MSDVIKDVLMGKLFGTSGGSSSGGSSIPQEDIDEAFAALAEKGVTVPDGATSADLDELIASIVTGNLEYYSGSITLASDASSVGIEVNDSSLHTNGELPTVAVIVNTSNFTPGAYVDAAGIIAGMAFRRAGTASSYAEEVYTRGASDSDEEYKQNICRFYGKKTWFYGTSLSIPLGNSNLVTNTKYFKAGDTYHYFIMY